VTPVAERVLRQQAPEGIAGLVGIVEEPARHLAGADESGLRAMRARVCSGGQEEEVIGLLLARRLIQCASEVEEKLRGQRLWLLIGAQRRVGLGHSHRLPLSHEADQRASVGLGRGLGAPLRLLGLSQRVPGLRILGCLPHDLLQLAPLGEET